MAVHKKIIGHSMNHSLSSQARTFFDMNQLSYQTGVPCQGDVFVTSSFLSFGTEVDCYRPFFVLTGRLSKLRGVFPDNVTEVSFQDTDRPEVRMEYELTNQQIANMYENGVFPELEDAKLFVENKENRYITRPDTVSTPDIMNNNMYSDLPMLCSVLMVKNAECPILFVQPEKQFNITLTAESSGYSLDSYMDAFQQEIVEVDERLHEDVINLQRSLEKAEIQSEPSVDVSSMTELKNPVVQELFEVTKPRVDEHVEADEEYIRQVKEVMGEEDVSSSTYDSPFEQMMLENEGINKSSEKTSAQNIEDVLADMPPVSGGPLTMEEVLARKKKQQQRLVNKQLASANSQEKAMPKNLDEIQQNAEKTLGDQNTF